jgi:hypothetical protein
MTRLAQIVRPRVYPAGMDIPHDEREQAREYVTRIAEICALERRMIRDDVLAFAALAVAVVVNVAIGLSAGGVVGAANVVGAIVLAFLAGVKYARTAERRAVFHRIAAAREEVETALAFAELDDAE